MISNIAYLCKNNTDSYYNMPKDKLVKIDKYSQPIS